MITIIKTLMYSKKNYEVKILEGTDEEKIKMVNSKVCPNCEGKLEMKGHYHSGKFVLYKCKNCNNHYAR